MSITLVSMQTCDVDSVVCIKTICKIDKMPKGSISKIQLQTQVKLNTLSEVGKSLFYNRQM